MKRYDLGQAIITVAAGLNVHIVCTRDGLREKLKEHITPQAPLLFDEVPVVVDDGAAFNRQLAALVESLKVRDERRFAIVAREPGKQKAQWKQEQNNRKRR